MQPKLLTSNDCRSKCMDQISLHTANTADKITSLCELIYKCPSGDENLLQMSRSEGTLPNIEWVFTKRENGSNEGPKLN